MVLQSTRWSLLLLFLVASHAWITYPVLNWRRNSGNLSSQRFFPKSRRFTAALTDAASDTTTERRVLHLYNSKTRSKEPVIPVRPDQVVTMYTCGPTVYDAAHVGNFRAFLTYDVVKRVLQYFGYTVEHVCNLTDVDDKILQRAADRKLASVRELTDHYVKVFFDDLEALHIVKANHYPRATDYVDAMMTMIETLSNKGLAYETADGSWYFRTQSQPGYGQQLVQLDYDEMESQDDQGGTENQGEKEHFADFCLWKAFKDGQDRDDMAWERLPTIQKGRPGWHLECSAMAQDFFPDYTIDLHGGGIDLKFPHHENEIAQSEGFNDGRTFCQCWFHNGFVNLDSEKMSKSTGNFLTLRQACATALEVRAYRYLVVSSQYRNLMSFSPQVMQQAVNTVQRIDKVRAQLESVVHDDNETMEESPIEKEVVPAALQNFETALLDDLSMPRASAALFSLVKAAEKEFKQDDNRDAAGLVAIRKAMDQMDQVFGIFYTVPGSEEEKQPEEDPQNVVIPELVLELATARAAAKDAKDWETADSLRTQITDLGFAVKDVKGGEPIISRIQA